MAIPGEDAELSTPEFWDNRYNIADTSTNQPTHEWFRGFQSLQPWLSRHLPEPVPTKQSPSILHLGCGDSVCVDFSAIVIIQMKERYAAATGIQWICADVRSLPFPDRTFAVAFDKGTLDAMIFGSPWDPPDVVRENTSKYVDEVLRVLDDDGVFLYVTFRQPHFVKPLLNRNHRWDVTVEELSDGEGSFGYYGLVLRKAKQS